MAITSYHTINGRIRAESTGGTRTGYLPDALGSVTATVDETGAVVNTYRYKPYGTQLSKTGAGADPKFQWVGQFGYLHSTDNLIYVRARTYLASVGSWIATDLTWPDESSYTYALLNPTSIADPSGLQIMGGVGGGIYGLGGIIPLIDPQDDGIGLGIGGGYGGGTANLSQCCRPEILPTADGYICYILPAEYSDRCRDCAKSAGFKSVRAWCTAADDWAKKKPPVSVKDLACLRKNGGKARSEAIQKCKNLPVGMRDKCEHCYASCKLKAECGEAASKFAGWLKELLDISDCMYSGIFDPNDEKANEKGRKFHPNCNECTKASTWEK